MERNFDRRFQSTHQVISIERSQEASHIFDANGIRPQIFQLPGEIHETVDTMHRTDRIGDGRFRVLAAGLYFAHGPQAAKDGSLVMDVTARTFRYLDDEELAAQRKAAASARKGARRR
jgi:hypothetical protein